MWSEVMLERVVEVLRRKAEETADPQDGARLLEAVSHATAAIVALRSEPARWDPQLAS